MNFANALRGLTRQLMVLLTIVFTLSAPAFAQPSPSATSACIEAGKASGMYWPGAKPARNFIGAEYNIAVYLNQGTQVSTDEAGSVGVVKPRGALSCGAVVLVKASDISPLGMVSQGFLADCGNWSTFAPVYVPQALVTEYPEQDRKLFDPREDDRLDALFISDAYWLSAARLSSCIGGVWDPDGRVDTRTGLRRPSFVATSSDGYVVEDRTSDTLIKFQGTGSNHQGDEIRNTAASMSIIRTCPTDPLLVWKGKIAKGEEDGDLYEVVCEEPATGERVSASLSAGMQVFESYAMDLEENDQAHPQPNGTFFLENLCPVYVSPEEKAQKAYLVNIDSWYNRPVRLSLAFNGLLGGDILLTDPNPYFAEAAFAGGGMLKLGVSFGNDLHRLVPYAIGIPQWHGGTEFYAYAPAGLGVGGGLAYQGGIRNDVGGSIGGGYYHSWAAWTDASGDRWDSLDDTFYTDFQLLIHPRGQKLGTVDGREVYEGGARKGSFVLGLHTAVSLRSGLEPGSMMSLAQLQAVIGFEY